MHNTNNVLTDRTSGEVRFGTDETAEMLLLTRVTLKKKRQKGTGPRFERRPDGRVVYTLEALRDGLTPIQSKEKPMQTFDAILGVGLSIYGVALMAAWVRFKVRAK
jgi:hypothetical protein